MVFGPTKIGVKPARAAALALALLVLAAGPSAAAPRPSGAPPAATAAGPSPKTELPPKYKAWLEEEVLYIITRTERDVFLKLETDKERELFIEAFWKQRDPTPVSPDNEARAEHYRRITYANRMYGRDAARSGWRTDRGRIYIILGEPNDIQKFDGGLEVYPAEIWFYQGKTDLGLPPGFNIVFFKEHGMGEYRLYSPATDGPQALLTGAQGDPIDFEGAYLSLKNKEPNLASVSLSLIPGEESGFMYRPTLSSDILLQRVASTPQRQIKEKYAEKFLAYKDRVEVEYTANYLDSDGLVKVFRDASGLSFIHFALEPRRLSINQFENSYYTTLLLTGSLALPGGKVIYQYDRTIDLKFDEARMREVGGLPFGIHDLLPVVPGEYRFSVLVKNEASKEFSTLEQTVRVSPPGQAPQITAPLLGYKRARLDDAQRVKLRAFQLGSALVYCQPNRIFLAKDTLVVALQVFGLDEARRPGAELRLGLLRDDRPFREIVRRAADLAGLPDVIEEIPLADFPPAHYALQVSLVIDGREAAKTGEEFDVTFRSDLPRPWVSSRVLPGRDNPMFDQILGIELTNLGRPDEALTHLERARLQKKDDPKIVAALGEIFMTRGEFARIVPLVEPLLALEAPPYEILYLAGRAYLGAGQFAKAGTVLDAAVARFGININILNALAESYRGLGKNSEALAAWRKSLELKPDQPEVRKMVEELSRRSG